MTTDVKLLLLPDAWQCETRICPPLFTPNQMQSYARANMAELLAENERLRGEVERLTFEMGCLQQQYDERTAYMIVHRGAGLACSDAVRSAYSDEHHRAERLAEALREVDDYLAERQDVIDGDDGAPQANDEMRLRRVVSAALDQEGGNG